MVEPRRQHRRIIVSAPKRDNRSGSNHHEHQRDERREDENPDWQAILRSVGVAPRLVVACFPDPLVCSDQFPSGISYHSITPALLFTTSITWAMAPVAFLAALPLARRFGWFWAEIPGHVRERAIGSSVSP